MVSEQQPIRRGSPRGFALVDVIVATVLLGVSLAVTISLAGRAVSSQRVGEELATAALLADEQLHMVLARGPDDYARRYSVQGTCEAPFEAYRYSLAFSGGTSTGDPYKVAASITWSSSGSPRSLTIDTLIAPRTGGDDADPDPVRTPSSPILRNQ